MEDFVARFFGNLIGRLHGPLTFRLIMQPTMAAIMAIRVAVKDAQSGRPAYLAALFRKPAERRQLLREARRHVAVVFVVALIIDTLYQALVFHWVYPGEAATVAALLAIVPYVILRGPMNRIVSRLKYRRERRGHAKT